MYSYVENSTVHSDWPHLTTIEQERGDSVLGWKNKKSKGITEGWNEQVTIYRLLIQ